MPVSDVDRAKAFYTEKVGFNADHDHKVSEEIRFVQLTPPGRPARCHRHRDRRDGAGLGSGPADRGADIEAAREELVGRGVEVTEVQEFPWGSFVFFSDPDGNGWAVQQIPPRD